MIGKLYLCLGVGRDIFRMKKNPNLPATCQTGIGFNLQNFGMDLFPIVFVNFKTHVCMAIPYY